MCAQVALNPVLERVSGLLALNIKDSCLLGSRLKKATLLLFKGLEDLSFLGLSMEQGFLYGNLHAFN